MSNHTNQEDIRKLAEMIKDIDFAMLTTVNEDGRLLSRPMSTQQVEFDGDLWFLTSIDTGKAEDIQREAQVNVAYSKPDKHRFVSVSGTAVLVNDRAKLDELWSPVYKAYFPKGKDDPDIRLLKVRVEQAEYWDSLGLIPTVIRFALAMTGKEVELSDNEKITLS